MRRTYRYDPQAKRLVEVTREAPQSSGPFVWSDLPGYVSPLSEPGKDPKWIEGRAARREELKRNNCREVDPSEFRTRND